MKFLCDQMLGTLAKWLRIYGFDTYFATDEIDDSKLIDISKKENRVLISRDIQLIQNARRENIDTILLTTTDLDEQIKNVIIKTGIDENKFLSRCIICNSKVEKIDKEKIEGKVPGRVFKNNKDFWYCKKCDKIYWKGSHIEKMKERIKLLS